MLSNLQTFKEVVQPQQDRKLNKKFRTKTCYYCHPHPPVLTIVYLDQQTGALQAGCFLSILTYFTITNGKESAKNQRKIN